MKTYLVSVMDSNGLDEISAKHEVEAEGMCQAVDKACRTEFLTPYNGRFIFLAQEKENLENCEKFTVKPIIKIDFDIKWIRPAGC